MKDGDPIAIILIMYMFIILVFWFQSTSSINPLGTNSTDLLGKGGFTGRYADAWTGIKWLGLMLVPFGLFLLVKGFTGEGSVFNRGRGEEEEE